MSNPFIAHNLYEIDDCIICLRPLSSNLVVLKCGHVMHFDCMDNFFKQDGNSCPICKEALKKRSYQRLLFRLEKVQVSNQIKITQESAIGLFNTVTVKLQTKEKMLEYMSQKIEELTKLTNTKDHEIGIFRETMSKLNMKHFYKQPENQEIRELK